MVKAPFHFCHSPDSAFSETLERESDRGPLLKGCADVQWDLVGIQLGNCESC